MIRTFYDAATLKPGVKKTPEGYYKGITRATRAGVFQYVIDGKSINVFRPPEQVFSNDSMESLKMIPITNLHPIKRDPSVVLLDAKTIKRHAVGSTGETVLQDGIFLDVSVCINDAEAISAIEKGRVELSCGYTSEFVEKTGVYDGQSYQYVQTDIRYNHLAIEDKGRAGPDVRLVFHDSNDNSIFKEIVYMKVVLDGKTYEVADDVGAVLAALAAERDGLKAQVSKTQAALDAATLQIADLKKIDIDKLVDDEAAKRIDLYSKVSSVLDSKDIVEQINKSPKNVMVSAIKKLQPNAVLDGKDDAYISGMFDAVLAAVKNSDPAKKGTVFSDSKDSGSGTTTYENAYKAYKDRLTGKK